MAKKKQTCNVLQWQRKQERSPEHHNCGPLGPRPTTTRGPGQSAPPSCPRHQTLVLSRFLDSGRGTMLSPWPAYAYPIFNKHLSFYFKLHERNTCDGVIKNRAILGQVLVEMQGSSFRTNNCDGSSPLGPTRMGISACPCMHRQTRWWSWSA